MGADGDRPGSGRGERNVVSERLCTQYGFTRTVPRVLSQSATALMPNLELNASQDEPWIYSRNEPMCLRSMSDTRGNMHVHVRMCACTCVHVRHAVSCYFAK
eukprot:7386503-Prymnesium_polylepis.4